MVGRGSKGHETPDPREHDRQRGGGQDHFRGVRPSQLPPRPSGAFADSPGGPSPQAQAAPAALAPHFEPLLSGPSAPQLFRRTAGSSPDAGGPAAAPPRLVPDPHTHPGCCGCCHKGLSNVVGFMRSFLREPSGRFHRIPPLRRAVPAAASGRGSGGTSQSRAARRGCRRHPCTENSSTSTSRTTSRYSAGMAARALSISSSRISRPVRPRRRSRQDIL